MLGVAEQTKRSWNATTNWPMNYSDETADEMAALQDQIDAGNLWELEATVGVAMDALRCPPDDADVSTLSGGEKPPGGADASCCLKSPTCSSLTNRPTTLTRNPSPGCKST